MVTTLLTNRPQDYLNKKLDPFLGYLCLLNKLVIGQRNDCLSAHLGVSLFSPFPFHKPSWSGTILTFCSPNALVPSALHPEQKIPWVFLGACWLSEVQWTAQIAWGVENSSVTGVLLSAKARWSFIVGALSMWNCFFLPGNSRICPHLAGP